MNSKTQTFEKDLIINNLIQYLEMSNLKRVITTY